MGSLPQITYYLRVIAKYVAIVGGVVLFIFLFYKGGTYLYRLIRPPAPPPPQQVFGKLPAVSFPQQNKQLSEYKIDTITGKLPILPDRMRVYKIVETEPSLFALQNVRGNLKSYGYTFGEQEVDQLERIYTWQNNYGNTIKYNILKNTFEIFQNPQLQIPSPELKFTSKEEPVSYVKNFLENLELDVHDIDFEKSHVTFYKISENGVVDTKDPLLANSARVNLFQIDLPTDKITLFNKIIENLAVVYPKLSDTQPSTMSLTVRLTSNGPIISDARYFHYPIDEKVFSDYPVISMEEAFKMLQDGKAFYMTGGNQPSISITSISLGNYLGIDAQKYTLPVIIFEGANFKAFVNALKL